VHENTRYLAAVLAVVAMNTHAVPAAGEKTDGKAVYETHCAGCHEKGVARAATPETMRNMTPDSVVRALETGVMRVVGTFSLNGPERAAVAEYVTGKSLPADWSAQVANQCPAAKWPASAEPLAGPHWNGWGVDARNTRFQPEAMAKLPKEKVKDLELQWVFAFPGETLAEAHASVVDGRLFVGSRSGQVYALDARTGCTHWVFQAEAAVKGPVLVGQVADGRWLAFLGDVGGRAYAVDAATGKEVWQLVADEHPSARLTASSCMRTSSISRCLRWRKVLRRIPPISAAPSAAPCCEWTPRPASSTGSSTPWLSHRTRKRLRSRARRTMVRMARPSGRR